VIAATLAALLVLPLLVLRGRTLARCYTAQLTLALFAWIVWRRLPGFDPYLGGVALAVVEVALFALFLARGSDVRWSANGAALVVAVVYALTIPAMLRQKTDGDEPFYLLVTESLVHDRDLDLRNQYANIDRSATGRTDIRGPQSGDPIGPHGEQYSRHEPFLPLLMVPGYVLGGMLGGLYGAVATIALFGVLLVRSTVRWMEDEGVPDGAVRAVFPFFAFAPPVLFYATRIWPEVPAAFFFVEALRGVRAQRMKRWLPALLGLVMLKLRFVLVAIGVGSAGVLAGWPGGVSPARLWAGARRRDAAGPAGGTPAFHFAGAVLVLIVPLLAMWFFTGDATSVHSWRELLPAPAHLYVNGFFGILVDGMSGIAFQAPFYLLGLAALFRWRTTPRGFRIGIGSSLLYILYLLPRPEWYGGWAPPLRYLVFLMPVLALGAAAIWEHVPRAAVAIAAVWTIGLTIHGLTYPWSLFHIGNGENALGEWLSRLSQADFSRLFPSFIRINDAAPTGAIAIVLLLVVLSRRSDDLILTALFTLALALGFRHAQKPGTRVELEDAHVVHDGGRMHPEFYTMARFTQRGGWILETGQSVSFLARAGTYRLDAITGLGATIEVAGRAYTIAPSVAYGATRITIPHDGRVTLRCLSGAVNLDRMERIGD
jgi:hypothetical protein